MYRGRYEVLFLVSACIMQTLRVKNGMSSFTEDTTYSGIYYIAVVSTKFNKNYFISEFLLFCLFFESISSLSFSVFTKSGNIFAWIY